jgi:hypothetical protein
MSSHQNLPQSEPSPKLILTLKTTTDTQLKGANGLPTLIPQGTPGRILAYELNGGEPFFYVDFGAATVAKVSASSDLVEVEPQPKK